MVKLISDLGTHDFEWHDDGPINFAILEGGKASVMYVLQKFGPNAAQTETAAVEVSQKLDDGRGWCHYVIEAHGGDGFIVHASRDNAKMGKLFEELEVKAGNKVKRLQ